MSPSATDRLKSIPVRRSLSVFAIAALVLAVTFFLEVSVIVHTPDVGDISAILEAAVRAVTTLLGAVSAIITIYNFFHEPDASGQTENSINVGGPADTIEIGGDLYQINADDVTFDLSEDTDSPSQAETESEEPSTEGESEES